MPFGVKIPMDGPILIVRSYFATSQKIGKLGHAREIKKQINPFC